ncbi:MAG: exopolysaccharide biosynthesis polyprenyl glycosylphosphotransferase [Gaiellaceae bacterium]
MFFLNGDTVSPARESEIRGEELTALSEQPSYGADPSTAALVGAPSETLSNTLVDALPRQASNEWRESLLRRMLAAGDILALLFGALWLGFLGGGNVSAFFWIVALTPAWVILAKMLGLYDRDQRALRHLTIDEAAPLTIWALLGTGGVVLFFHLPVPGSLGAKGAGHLALATFASAFVLRGLMRHLWRRITPPERTVIVGSGPETRAFLRKIELFPETHLEIVANITEMDIEELRRGDGRLQSIDRIVVASAAIDGEAIARLIAVGQEQSIRLSVIPLTRSLFSTAVQLSRIADLPVLEYRTWAIGRSTLFLKRLLDFFVSLISLLVLLPVFVLIALAIKLDSRGPVIYSQRRAGLGGKPFLIFKFRTMVRDAEARLKDLVPFDKLAEPMFKLTDDPRVTRFGGFLRHWSLDELPQLMNVLIGRMSLVGPRPEQIELVERYEPEHLFRVSVKPGLTGPMQVYGRGELKFQERLAVEREYIENLSIGRDLRILVLTVAVALGRKGAL